MKSLPAIWHGQQQQLIYRALLDAMSYPGNIQDLTAHLEDDHSSLGILATLTDHTVTLADPHELLRPNDLSMLQVPQADMDEADFVLMDGRQDLPETPNLKCGDIYYPENGATLILIVENFNIGGLDLELNGPGVNGSTNLQVNGLAESWLSHRESLNQHYPIGVDLMLCSAKHMVALPRTTQIKLLQHN